MKATLVAAASGSRITSSPLRRRHLRTASGPSADSLTRTRLAAASVPARALAARRDPSRPDSAATLAQETPTSDRAAKHDVFDFFLGLHATLHNGAVTVRLKLWV